MSKRGQDAGPPESTFSSSHPAISAGALGDRRIEVSRTSAEIDSDVRTALSGEHTPSANTRSYEEARSPQSTNANRDGSSEARDGTTNKRKRAAGIKDFAYKRPKQMEATEDVTLDPVQAEVQPSIEEEVEGSQTHKKPRKVRKDKGVPRKRAVNQPEPDADNSNDQAPPVTRPTSTRELRKRPTAAPQQPAEVSETELNGDEEVADSETQQRKRKKRKPTPDGNEDVEIDPKEVQMADMLIDKKTGKVSTLERRMREIDWDEVNRKRKAARMPPEEGEGGQTGGDGRADEGGGGQTGAAGGQENDEDMAAANAGPARQRTRMVNGVITVVDEAQHVDRHAEGDAEMETLEVVEHEDLTERITSHSWIDNNRRDPSERKYGRRKADPWNLRDTDKFYEALRMFGTDFFVIAKMFKGKTRRQVKMKFVREEHDDPDRVKRALHGERKLLDIEAFKEVTGIAHFKSPEEILSALEEDRREREEQIVRAREEYDEEQRQKKFLEASGAAPAETGESAKENEAPGLRGKKKSMSKNKKSQGPVASADQAAEVVETIEE